MGKRLFTIAWFATIIVGAFMFGTAQHTDADTNEPSIYAGVFRKQHGNKWLYTHGHASVNIDWAKCQKVSEARPAGLVVKISNPGTQVGVPIMVPDETLTSLGVTMGASVTRDKVRVFFFRHGKAISCWDKVFDTIRSNIWGMGVTIR